MPQQQDIRWAICLIFLALMSTVSFADKQPSQESSAVFSDPFFAGLKDQRPLIASWEGPHLCLTINKPLLTYAIWNNGTVLYAKKSNGKPRLFLYVLTPEQIDRVQRQATLLLKPVKSQKISHVYPCGEVYGMIAELPGKTISISSSVRDPIHLPVTLDAVQKKAIQHWHQLDMQMIKALSELENPIELKGAFWGPPEGWQEIPIKKAD